MTRATWTPQQMEHLRQHYPHECTQTLAAALGMSVKQVHSKAYHMGIGKTREFRSQQASRVALTNPDVRRGQFKKGQAPWNKGTHGLHGHHPNFAKHQFKKGRPAHEARNYRPIGSTRIALGMLERKVTDDPSLAPVRRWTPVHRLVWQEAHGPIPDGHIVVFKPGTHTTVEAEITVDKLECISRAENARRNHPKNKSPELARLYQLKGAITRQRRRIEREAQEKEQRA